MNLGQLIKRVQRSFGDESEAQITIEDITAWLNEGQLHIARITNCLQETVELDPVAGQASYNLPDDFIREDRVTFQGRRLLKSTLQEVDKLYPNREDESARGCPTTYYIYGRRLFLYPYTDHSDTDTLDVMYVKSPATMTSTNDTPEIPAHFQPEIVKFALMRAKESNEDDSRADALSAQIEFNLGLAVDEHNNPHTDSYPAVRDISYVGDYW